MSDQECKYDEDGRPAEVFLQVSHPIYLLAGSSHFRIFTSKDCGGDLNFEKIFTEIFSASRGQWNAYGIKKEEFDSALKTIKFENCTQYLEDDLHFFLRLCETYGVRLVCHGDNLYLKHYDTNPQSETSIVPAKVGLSWTTRSTSKSCVLNCRNVNESKSLNKIATECFPANSTEPNIRQIEMPEPDPEKAGLVHEFITDVAVGDQKDARVP